jgi:hypothetical protein
MPPTLTTKRRTSAKKAATTRTFHDDLVLNRWMLGFFFTTKLNPRQNHFRERLSHDRLEGFAEDGQTRFFHEITGNMPLIDGTRITIAELRRYDFNIVEHWKAITERRNKTEGHELRLKYFQWLSLLFTEIYLDWYFNRRQQLLDGLNKEMEHFDAEQGELVPRFQPYTAADLNKLAYWSATGSGKTLLLHVNIRQYLHYFQRGNTNRNPDQIILLTPNEGLSRQHYEEAQKSGFFPILFEKEQMKQSQLGSITIIDINKLADENGEKTIAAETFAGNNLVLVDEGHRGTGKEAKAWMRRRAIVIGDGFAFEYSATFGQAMAKADDSIRETYAKSTLFDYSYKFFYEDEYGKDFLILNFPAEKGNKTINENTNLYFTACLLSFYQQLHLWETHSIAITRFNIEKPLWVFVGNKVNDEDSDILTVLDYLAQFVNDPTQIQAWLKDLLTDTARLLDAKQQNIFHGKFAPLLGRDPAEIYTDILAKLFNTTANQRLKLVNIKNSKGELALRIGEAKPFGLVNVGDDTKLFATARERKTFDCEPDDFGGSLFNTINKPESKLNLLIGSRKFTEGWSSWRVSTMGLLNMGKNEGTQIIQLFGRGVRLKGENFSLKRSKPEVRPKGTFLEKLETLNVFGVNADYMARFKEYLKEEGITPPDEMLQLDFPTRSKLSQGKLKTLALRDGFKDNQQNGFKNTLSPELYKIPENFKGKIKLPHVELDLYPRIEALASRGVSVATQPAKRETHTIHLQLMPLFDWDKIFLSVQDHKLRRSWHNLRVSKEKLRQFCETNTEWFTLYAPASEMEIHEYKDVEKQESLLIQLLTDYTESFYKSLKNAYEGEHYQVVYLNDDDGSMVKFYHFEIEPGEIGEKYQEQLLGLKRMIEEGRIKDAAGWSSGSMVAICFEKHLYYPLFHLGDESQIKALPLKMRPVVFDNPDEVRFVRDLEAFSQSEEGKIAIAGRSLYLMRNADNRAKGLGFATAGGFYPDFLLWLLDEVTGAQTLAFIDPKGFRNLDLRKEPKLQLYKEIKQIQNRLGDEQLCLEAFVLSVTPPADLLNVTLTEEEFEERHILFMHEKSSRAYLQKLFEKLKPNKGAAFIGVLQ